MFFDPVAAHMMQMAVMQVVGVAGMVHAGVAATGAMAVRMILMFLRGRHSVFPTLLLAERPAITPVFELITSD
jgi:hypothetical protein